MPRRQPIQVNFSSGVLGVGIEQRSDLGEVSSGLKECHNFIPLAQGSLEKRHGRTIISHIPNARKGRVFPFFVDDSHSYAVIVTDDDQLRVVDRNGIYIDPAHPPESITTDPLMKDGTMVFHKFLVNHQGRHEIPYISDDGGPVIRSEILPQTTSGHAVGIEEVTYVMTIPAAKINSDFNIVMNTLLFRKVNFEFKGTPRYSIEVTDKPRGESGNVLIEVPTVNVGDTLDIRFRNNGSLILYFTVIASKYPIGLINPVWGYSHSLSEKLDSYSEIKINRLEIIDIANPGVQFEVGHNFGEIDYEEIQFDHSPESNLLYFAHRDVEPSRLKYDFDTNVFTFERLVTDHILKHVPLDWGIGDFPGCVVFHESRLWFAGTHKHKTKVWASQSNDYDEFANPSSTVHSNDPMVFKISKYGEIRWLASANVLMFGTDIGEFSLESSGDFLAPGDIRAIRRTSYGSRRIQPVVVGDRVVYVTADGLKLRDLSYSDEEQSWLSKDLTFTNEDITISGIAELLFLQNPFHLIKCRLNNNTMAVCSYQKHLNIVGWFTEDSESDIISASQIMPNGISETIFLIDDHNGELTIQFEDVNQDNYLDSRTLITNIVPSKHIVASHLKGKNVSIIADGAHQPNVQLDSEGIGTIEFEAKVISLGLPYPAKVVTIDVNDTNRYGESSISLMKRWNKIFVRIFNSAIPIINGVSPPERLPSTLMDTSESNISGDVEVINLGYDKFSNITIEQNLPLKCNILGVFGELGEENL